MSGPTGAACSFTVVESCSNAGLAPMEPLLSLHLDQLEFAPPNFKRRRSRRLAAASAEEGVVAADDAEIDEAGAAVIGRRVPHFKAVEVERAHGFHRGNEAFARQVLTGAAQTFHQHLGCDESFEARERKFFLARLLLKLALIIVHERVADVPWKRNHLRDADASSRRAQLARQRLAPDE